ncbi:DEAD-box ATP-dependent RNA helicase 17 [Chlorella sorokiniana]|uniref:ATP-dependent RNA helicase n=1 Tax=Chlorella sorokiniana TaxID=3076 RepID=A0A2P6U224_CHLSO|nr:DEAD-box ATP-dependent RNA helicase 17 [Chlorella sorokiniana]|eukprot:PRW60362.1 DEAD-box ATP-dependent RNA helicase 17 [Chlorella sorokiniana]
MGDDGGDDGLFLNLALPEAPAAHPSRTQQRKQKWTQQRTAKKQAHKHSGSAGGAGRGRPSWLGGAQQQHAAEAPASGSSAGQLKGYSLGGDAPAALAPAPAAPASNAKQQQRAPAQQQHGDNGRFAFGFGAQAQQQRGRQPQQQRQQPQQQRQQPQAQYQQQPAQRPQHDGQHPRAAYQQQQQQRRPQRQSDQPRQPVVAQAHSGAELAKAHFDRRQARHVPKQQQQQQRDASPEPPAGPAAAGGAPAARRGGGGAAAGDNGERPSKRIGKLRLASRQAGYREATPDLDEVKAAGSDAESDDVLAAVAAAVARDKEVQAELAGEVRQRFARYASSDSEGEDPAAGAPAGQRRRGGAAAANGNGLAADVARFAGSSDEEGEGGPAGVVEFGGGDGGTAERRAAKRRKRERADGAAAGGKRPKSAAVSVRPGELVHAGAVGGGAAAGGAAQASGEDGFAALGLSPQLADHLAAHGFAAPTGVQQQAIPVLLGRRDALINAPTGSGKTLSYLAPIVADLAAQQPAITRAQGTFAIVICPTRELCLQVADVLTMLVRRFVWLVGGAIHGGEDRGKEKARLRKGVTVLVATPGRLLDHLQNTKSFRTEDLRWLVLDEADRLLDLGFEKKIAEVCALLDARSTEADYAQRRTTALLSATLHSRLGSLASLSLKDPAAIGFEYDLVDGEMVVRKAPGQQAQRARQAAAGGGDAAAWAAATAAVGGTTAGAAGAAAELEQFEIPAQLKQRFVEVPCKLRLVALAALLRARLAAAPARCKMVVFLSTTDSVEFYHSVFADAWEEATGERLLQASGAPILKLHGNMPQSERTAAFLAFTKAPAGVLLCTDVAARGLDFPAVTDIVQFDPPGEAAEYVHRVGRTARLGQRGDAVLFLLPSERGYVEHLHARGVSLREQPVVPLLNHVLGADRKAGIDLPVERHQGAYALQKQLMEGVAADRHLTALGGDAFRSWVRSYATHATAVKDIFHVRRLHLGHVAHAFALKERPTLVGKSATKASAQQKRKATHLQQGGGKKQRGSGSGKGGSSGNKSGGKRQPRKAAAQVVGGKGTMYNLA